MVKETYNLTYSSFEYMIRNGITEDAYWKCRIYWSLKNEYEVNYTIPRNLKWNDEVCRVKHIHKLTKW